VTTETTVPKLTFWQKALYSAGSIGLNIISLSVSSWLLYFYVPPSDRTDMIAYAPAGLVGAMLFIAGVWDGIIDPFLGHWSDSMKSRWGRRRPFLMFGTPVMAVTMILLWTPPVRASSVFNGVYLLVVAALYYTAFSAVGMPYDGTLPEMAPDTHDRVKLSTWKMVFGIIGFVGGSLTVPMLWESLGPLGMGIAVAIIGAVSMYLVLIVLREPEYARHQDPMPAWEAFKATFTNGQFLIFFCATLLIHVSYTIILAISPYFVTQVVGGTEGDVTIFQGLLVLLMVICAPFWIWVRTRFRDKWVVTAAMALMGVTLALNFVVTPSPTPGEGLAALVPGLLIFPLTALPISGYLIMAYAMMGNVVDYDEMLTGRRREAIYYGNFSLATNAGSAVAAAVLPVMLKTFGDTQANPMGIRLSFILAGVMAIAAATVFLGYRLGDTPEETRQNLGLSGSSSSSSSSPSSSS
jgi:GPH family glycoside/pentoside/hexuronide:cation symporter